MRLNTLLLFLCLSLLIFNFSSCKKLTGAGNIKGKVLTKGTDAPVNAAHVEVFHEEKDIFSSLASRVGEGWTAPDGSFLIDYDAPSGGSIYVTAKSAGYIWDLTENTKHKDLNKKLTIKLTPEAWMKLHLKNVNPSAQSDWISIAAHKDMPVIYGDKVDTTLNIRMRGNTLSIITVGVGKRSGTTAYEKNLYCPGHDTTFFEILY